MRGNIVGLLALALMCVCGVASSSIIYNVDITDGTETLTGTITTDGTLGSIALGNITAWSLTASGAVAFTMDSGEAGASDTCSPFGCGLTATPTSLSYDFAIALAAIEFDVHDIPSNTLERIKFFNEGVFVSKFLNPGFAQYVMGGFSGETQIATAAAPEPATLALLGLGLAGLGFSRRRKHT